jgi:hypothetical protein
VNKFAAEAIAAHAIVQHKRVLVVCRGLPGIQHAAEVFMRLEPLSQHLRIQHAYARILADGGGAIDFVPVRRSGKRLHGRRYDDIYIEPGAEDALRREPDFARRFRDTLALCLGSGAEIVTA